MDKASSQILRRRRNSRSWKDSSLPKRRQVVVLERRHVGVLERGMSSSSLSEGMSSRSSAGREGSGGTKWCADLINFFVVSAHFRLSQTLPTNTTYIRRLQLHTPLWRSRLRWCALAVLALTA